MVFEVVRLNAEIGAWCKSPKSPGVESEVRSNGCVGGDRRSCVAMDVARSIFTVLQRLDGCEVVCVGSGLAVDMMVSTVGRPELLRGFNSGMASGDGDDSSFTCTGETEVLIGCVVDSTGLETLLALLAEATGGAASCCFSFFLYCLFFLRGFIIPISFGSTVIDEASLEDILILDMDCVEFNCVPWSW